MKLSTLPIAFLATVIMATPTPPSTAPLTQLNLPDPQDWIAGPRLFPTNVVAGYHANLTQYNKDSWAKYVKGQCERFSACTSSITYSGKNRIHS